MRKFKSFWQETLENLKEEDNLLLQEGLIRTYPVDKFISSLVNIFPNFPRKNTFLEPKNVVILFSKTDISKDEKVVRLSNLTGYQMVESKFIDLKNLFKITYEPKITGIVNSNSIPDYLFHITPLDNLNKIKKIGLTPRDSKTIFNHSGNRIYLMVSSDFNKDIKLLFQSLLQNRTKVEPYVALTINSDKQNKNYFYDPSFQLFDISPTSYGIFTLQNIEPDRIKPLFKLEIP